MAPPWMAAAIVVASGAQTRHRAMLCASSERPTPRWRPPWRRHHGSGGSGGIWRARAHAPPALSLQGCVLAHTCFAPADAGPVQLYLLLGGGERRGCGSALGRAGPRLRCATAPPAAQLLRDAAAHEVGERSPAARLVLFGGVCDRCDAMLYLERAARQCPARRSSTVCVSWGLE